MLLFELDYNGPNGPLGYSWARYFSFNTNFGNAFNFDQIIFSILLFQYFFESKKLFFLQHKVFHRILILKIL